MAIFINKRLLMIGCGRSNNYGGTCALPGTLCGPCQGVFDTVDVEGLLIEHRQLLTLALRSHQEGSISVLREIGDLDGLLRDFPELGPPAKSKTRTKSPIRAAKGTPLDM